MSKAAPRIKAMALRASRDPKRSPLHHWMKDKYDTLAPLLAGRRVDWEPVSASVQKAGITDYSGGTPTEHTLRRTWRTVRKIIAAERAAPVTKPPRKLQPRDMPADWRPTPVAASPPALAGPPPQASLPSSSALPPLTHPSQVRVVGQASFGVITSGPLTPEPDYTGMGIAERKIARAKWHLALRQPG